MGLAAPWPRLYHRTMLTTILHDGPDTAPPLVIAHGLYGSGRNWGVIAKRLSDSRKVVAVDMRNHGTSPWTDSHSYTDMAADLAEVIADQGRDCDLLGHSMGGKAAMVLALTQPGNLRKLVVADIAPVAYTHSQLPFIHALRAVDLTRVSRRSDAEAQLAAQGVDPALCSFFTQSLDIAESRWRLNLDTLEAEMPKIMSFPDLAATWPGPALFLTGALSDYVRPEHRDRIRALFPGARFAKIPGAGHWLHADAPRPFEAAVRVFLDA